MEKKPKSFRLSTQALEDLAIIAKIHQRPNTNMLEVLIAEAKRDLQERGKWPKG